MSIKAMKEALEALAVAKSCIEDWGAYASDYFKEKWNLTGDIEHISNAITALRQAIEEAEKAEPVAWLTRDKIDGCWYPTAFQKSNEDTPLYTTPPA